MSPRDAVPPSDIRHIRSGGVSLVIDVTPPHLPRILHWGSDLGDCSSAELASLLWGSRRQAVANQPDEPLTLTVLPENSLSWVGTPGLEGHRDGQAFSTRFEVVDVHAAANAVQVSAKDDVAGLHLDLGIELTAEGLGKMSAALRNTGTTTYTVDALALCWPVPQQATELVDFAGRHGRERSPQRHPFTIGTFLREGRHGRTGADATLLLIAGEAGFRYRSGEAWAVHVGWSGNHRTFAERMTSGESVLGGGELLLPGEVQLAAGDTYTTPTVYASYGVGIDQLSGRFHRYLRARRPAPAQPRPVTGNCWEAVYFNHRLDRLLPLADRFAEVGIERFVLDDGWFRHRRDDTAGLGDWYVDEDVWPDGLHPLVDRLRSHHMQFGLWVEPEMINSDSDLARAHPDWILATGDRLPPEQRHQQVLNLGNPEAFAYIRDRLNALVDEYDIDYLKWDHNRDLIEAGDQASGRAGVHAQTLATYALIDDLKKRHPALAIESCSSGGSRADLGIMERVDRMWGSDCTDAHERQAIQRYTGLLLPPELIGSHVSADPNHQSWRRLSLAMRAVTAMFGDLGVEWDISSVDDDARRDLAAWIALYKQWRPLLHSGEVVHVDHPDPAVWAHGVVSDKGDRALFAVVFLETSVYGPPGMLRLPGLDPKSKYHLKALEPSRAMVDRYYFAPPPWWETGLTLTGQCLANHGFQLPDIPPDEPLLLSVEQC